MTEVTLEFGITMKGVDLLKLNHNVHVLYIVRYLLLYIQYVRVNVLLSYLVLEDRTGLIYRYIQL